MKYIAPGKWWRKYKIWRSFSAISISLFLLIAPASRVSGNPTGGAVVAGGATIGAAGVTLTINQSTQNAIINWQQFSIASGETTKFIVPNSSAATLNRVVGGNPSAIYGTLQSNGILYLVNPNGIVVGPGGRIDTSSFLASTLDVSNQQFLAGGNLEFSGSSNAAIDNAGVIHGASGDVYLIANQVNNTGTLSAPQGNVGLAAGTDVLFQQAGNQHLFVQANPTGTKRATGVTNAGTIQAAAAELKAAGGNAYALAINNSGSIAATGFKKVNGQVYLTSEGGNITNSGTITATTASGNGGTIVLAGTGTSTANTVLNSGTLDASAITAGGQGGSVSVRNMGGTTIHSGRILARGGSGGQGGSAEVSGAVEQFTGTVDLTAKGGTTGNLLLDPVVVVVSTPTLNVVTGGGGSVTSGQNTVGQTTIDPTVVQSALNSANLTLNADTNITVSNGITWNTSNTLTLSTNTAGSTINLNAPISGVSGGLTINTKAATDQITTGAAGTVSVANFTLLSGTWNQNTASLPAFTASQNFSLQGTSTFERFTGGTGATGTPYQITDVYGLQGLASPSGSLLTANAELVNNIDASGTTTWNSGAGFVPIGKYDGTNSSDANAYQGTFNGQGFTISALKVNLPSSVSGVGLFGDTASGSTLKNIQLAGLSIVGNTYVGGLVGVSNSSVSNVVAGGTITGTDYVGGLTGISSGAISSSYSTAAVNGNASGLAIGGLDGFAQFGSILNCYSTGAVTGGSGSTGVGGLVGENNGTVETTYSTGIVTGGTGSTSVGGLVGSNGGTVQTSYWLKDTGFNTGLSGIGSSSSNTGATPETVAALEQQSTFTPAGTGATQWDFSTPVWVAFNGTNTPQLSGLPTTTPPIAGATLATLSGTAFLDNGVTDSSGVTIDLIYNGTLLGTTTTATTGTVGSFSFNVSAADLTGGILLTDATDKGNTFYQSNAPVLTIGGIDIWGSTLRVQADAASNAALKTTAGNLSANGINYAVTGANLSTTSGVNMDVLSHYTLGGNINAATIDFNGATVTGTTAIVTALGNLTIQNSTITMSDANFTGFGNGYVSSVNANGDDNGVHIISSTINAQGGSISLTGTAGYDNPGGGLSGGVGIHLDGDAVLETSGGGNITLAGTSSHNIASVSTTGNNGGPILEGVAMDGSGNSVQVASGLIFVTGFVSSGSAGNSTISGSIAGIAIREGTLIEATGTGGSIVFSGSANGSTAYDSSANGSSQNEGIAITGNTSPNTILSVGTNGSLILNGTAGAIDSTFAPNFDNTGDATGLDIGTGSQITGGAGATLTLTGKGGAAITNDGNAASAGTSFTGSATGINLGDNDQVGSAAQITVGTGGGITMTGTGGTMNITNDATPTAHQDPGVQGTHIKGGTLVTANGTATITINGTGGTSTAGTNTFGTAAGVIIGDTSTMNPANTVVSSGSGAITITGTGGTSPNLGIGVVIIGGNGGTATVESTSGGINITGVGGSGYVGTGLPVGDYIPNYGVGIVDAATLMTGGTGTISLTGTGGPNGVGSSNSYGIGIKELTSDPTVDSSPVIPVITAGGAFSATSPNGTGISFNANLTAKSASIGTETTTGDPTTISSGPFDIENSTIILNGGNFTAYGSSGSVASSATVVNTTINSGGGSINITGESPYGGLVYNSAEVASIGVYINNSILESASSNQPSITSGDINILGNGFIATSPSLAGNLSGIFVTHSVVSVVNGAISLTGNVLLGTAAGSTSDTSGSGNAVGVAIDDGSAITSTGTGSITLSGDSSGAVATFSALGVYLSGATTNSNTSNTITTTVLSAAGGAGISITGDAGAVASSPGGEGIPTPETSGVLIENGVNLLATGSAPIALDGTGGVDANPASSDLSSESSRGLSLRTGNNGGLTGDSPNVLISSNSGAISLTGTGGSSIGNVSGISVDSESGDSVSITSTAANISLVGSAPNEGSVNQTLSGSGDGGATGVDIGGDQSEGSVSTITASAGSIYIGGTVSSGSDNSKEAGVVIDNDAQVTASGTGGTNGATAQGDLTILGDTTGSTAQYLNAGVLIGDQDTTLSASGNVADAHGGSGLTIHGTAGAINGSTGTTFNNNGVNSVFINPVSVGIAISDGSTTESLGSAPMTLNGTGGTNSSTDALSGSAGVGIFSLIAEQTTSVSSGGNLSITGVSGSSPSAGIGVLLGGSSNLGTVSVTSGGTMNVTGTGGAGNASGTIPNAGILEHPNTGSVLVSANGGNLTFTGNSGGSSAIMPGIDIFSTGVDPQVNASGTVNLVSNSGPVDYAGTTTATTMAVNAPLGTNSIISNIATLALSLTGGNFTLNQVGPTQLSAVSTQNLIINAATHDVNMGTTTATDLTIVGAGNVTLGANTTSALTIDATGNLIQTGALKTSLLSIADADAVTLTNTGNNITNLGPIVHNGAFDLYTDPGLVIQSAITGNAPVTITEVGGNITIGPGGSITDSGEGNDVVLAAGTNLANSHYITNNSANAIQVSNGANFFLYSSDPTYDTFGGLTVDPANVIYGATYPQISAPTGGAELFFVSTIGDVGPNVPTGGSSPPSTTTGGAGGGGGTIVPPVLIPQPTLPPQPPPPPTPGSPTTGPVVGTLGGPGQPPLPPPFSFQGNGTSTPPSQQGSGLANSSGNSGQVGTGDVAQLGNGQLNNVANPQAAGELNQALGPVVFNNLTNALQTLTGWTDTGDTGAGDGTATGDDTETILTGGDVAEVGDNGTKKIPPSQAPPQLQQALGGNVLQGLGAGH